MPKTKVILKNRFATFLGGYDWETINDVLKYRRPGWDYTNAGRIYVQWKKLVEKGEADEDDPQGWDGYIHLLSQGRVGTGVFLAMKEKLEELGMKFEIDDQRRPPEFFNSIKDIERKARNYQLDCVAKMIEASKTGGLVLNATGSGKTFIAGLYFGTLCGAGLFLVDELSLLKQAQGEIARVMREAVGEIGNGVFAPERVTVGTIQTVHRHRFDPRFVPWTKTLQTIIIDELHLALNRSNFQTIAVVKPPTVFGLTATLELKKKHISMRAYDLCGPVVFEYPLRQGVKEGVLSKGIAISVGVENKFKSPPVRGWSYFQRRNGHRRNYQEEYVSLIVEGKKRNEVIKSFIKEAHRRGKYIILLLERVQHLKDMGLSLGDLRHHLVFGEKKVDQRIESKVKFEAGGIRVLLVNKVFKKGVDIKRVDVIIDGAGMKSRNDCVQKYGRGVRMCAEKDGLIYIDIADIGNRFEKAAKIRINSLKRIGVPVYKVDSSLGPDKILDLAEKKLKGL
jgi:superfamily II DNA or RNA helicase